MIEQCFEFGNKTYRHPLGVSAEKPFKEKILYFYKKAIYDI